MSQRTLITGGNGYLARRVAQQILASHPSERVLLTLRDPKGAQAEALRNFLKNDRVEFCSLDLDKSNSINELPWGEFDSIIHLAARTNFNVEEDLANRINRDASLALARKAKSLGQKQIKNFTYVSTIYSSGLREGRIDEEFLTAEAGFANHYERSKWEVEDTFKKEFSDLNWKICRAATVMADSLGGQVNQFNATHNTLKLVYYGLISVIPGKAETPCYFVLGDETARAIAHLHFKATQKKIFNLCHRVDQSILLGDLVNLAFDLFLKDPSFKARRSLKPLFVNQDSFDSLVKGVQAFSGQVLSQAVTSIAPFGRQLFIRKEMQNANTCLEYPDWKAWDTGELVTKTCNYLSAGKFKKAEE